MRAGAVTGVVVVVVIVVGIVVVATSLRVVVVVTAGGSVSVVPSEQLPAIIRMSSNAMSDW